MAMMNDLWDEGVDFLVARDSDNNIHAIAIVRPGGESVYMAGRRDNWRNELHALTTWIIDQYGVMTSTELIPQTIKQLMMMADDEEFDVVEEEGGALAFRPKV